MKKSRINIRRSQTERDANLPVQNEKRRPGDQERNAVGQHHRRHGADSGFFTQRRLKHHNEREIGHQRGDDVGRGVTDAVGRLREFRRIRPRRVDD